jgi:hypothetical protein
VILVSDCCGAFSQSSYEEHVRASFLPFATILPLDDALAAVSDWQKR